MTMKAVKKMTIGRSAEGEFGFEVNGEVTRLIFKNSGKAHNIVIEVSKADLLREVANLSATPAPAPEVPATPVDTQPAAE